MKQVVQDFKSGKIRVIDTPVPQCGPNMVLVRNIASAISVGTERGTVSVAKKSLIGKARARPDLVKKTLDAIKKEGLLTTLQMVRARLEDWKPMGYSSAGKVIEVGEGVNHVRPGDHVACGGGGYAVHAEIIAVPKNLCVRLSEGISFEDAAFTTIASISLQAVRQAEVNVGDTIVVYGLGLVGLLAVEILKANGARVIGVDVDPEKIEYGITMGADDVKLPGGQLMETVKTITGGVGADAVILTASTKSKEPMSIAPSLLRDRGRIVVVGKVNLELDWETFYYKELDLRFSRSSGPGRYDPTYEEKGVDYPIGYVKWTEGRNMEAIVQLISQGKLKPSKLITHKFPIDKAEDAYKLITEGSEKPVGVLITYGAPTKEVEKKKVSVLSNLRKDSKLRIGLIGAGKFGRTFIIPNLVKNPDASIAMVATAHGHTAKMVAEKYKIPTITTDPMDVLKSKDVDIVFILTRHNLHAPLVIEAMKQRKMVYVEKPLVMNWDELHEIENTAGKVGSVWLMVGFNRVFSPHFKFLRKRFPNGVNFLVYRVNAGPLPSDYWMKDPTEGGGRWIGEGVHFLHFGIHWMSKEPDEVYVSGIPLSGEGPDENVSVLVDFGNRGILFILYTSRGAKTYPKEHVEVWGDGKTGIIENYRLSKVHPDGKKFKTRLQDKGHKNEIISTINAALSGNPPPLQFDELISTHKWMLRVWDKVLKGV